MIKFKIISVVGARPNFMKIAPFIRAIEEHNASIETRLAESSISARDCSSGSASQSLNHVSKSRSSRIDHLLVHTGQHYDDNMSKAFFEALDIPEADINLGIGSGSHAEQVGLTMIAFEKVIRQEKPDWVIVVGDVNATCACSITAKKEHVRLAHIEAGLRSGDMSMPEEVNRLVTDRLSDLLFTPDRLSGDNLLREGVDPSKIKFVGNIMIDTLEAQRQKAAALRMEDVVSNNRIDGHRGKLTRHSFSRFALLTLHRPSNVDNPEILSDIVNFLTGELAEELMLLWAVHPRTENRLKEFGFWEKVMSAKNVVALKPLGYHELLRLNMDAAMVLTDSGGLQEECCVLGTPCLTLRWNTERPVTLREHGGASVLAGNDVARIRKTCQDMLQRGRAPARPELWDGKTAPRIVKAIVEAD